MQVSIDMRAVRQRSVKLLDGHILMKESQQLVSARIQESRNIKISHCAY